MTTANPIGRCPRCGYDFDAATAADGSESAPDLGDLTICLRCGELMRFDICGVREVGADELRALDPETAERIRAAVDVHRRVDPMGWWAGR